ncbi:DUF4815 domain-containing protein [Aestuariivirga sp. YIM B02566]|uniref:DUF4815 domain-containing protein n=1 Tax=Taklimakanibacter albus TaxID=2800327 RepID=A0ACC5R6X3_9HYPH|nr:DUF4815 domain-containing protein [Aestuariivirga sp. YIM B02566]MBK1868251.1 DUF4815 domain-containing protein [Aestuariivirga sp. YIM B02566]
MASPYAHPLVPNAYDRSPSFPQWEAVIMREGVGYSQGAEINEAQSLAERRHRRVGNLVARDGDRVSGAEIIVDRVAGTARLTPGTLYIRGDVRPIGEKLISAVPMTGEIRIGVRITTTVIDEIAEPALYGLHPGEPSEGEPGAVRVAQAIAWSIEGDEEAGDFIPVYLLKDGTVVDQTPPPQLSGFNQALALYDRDSNGNYIVEGCRVTALGKIGSKQHFSISEGVANIMGFKRSRAAALRHQQEETWDNEQISAEPHNYPAGGGAVVIPVNHSPIDSVQTVIITRQTTQTVVRGAVTNTMDNLPHASVTSIISVTQGATTFTPTTDYVLNNDRVDWTSGGAEPATGSSYSVTYRYLSPVAPSAIGPNSVTVTGGVAGTTALITYRWKLNRIDLLCLDSDGLPVYLTGVASRETPVAPLAPFTLLPLAEITNNWLTKPSVVNTGVRAYHMTAIDRMYKRIVDLLDLTAQERLRRDIDSREPVAKKGVFVDPFTSDRYRDQGEAQTAAIFLGSMQLAIDPTFKLPELDGPVCLDYTEEIIISQPLVSGCSKINPYSNYEPLPGALALTPSSDFWVEHVTEWTSPVTRQFTGNSNRTTTSEELVDEREELLEFLRQINIDFTARGFGAGENLASLTFDGVNVTPPGLTADANGRIIGTFQIPANVTAGQKAVIATGAGGTSAQALFVGQGRVEIETMRRVTTITRAPANQTVAQGRPPRNEGNGNADPLAQTFTLPEGRHVAGVNLRFCAKGVASNGVLIQIVTVENGIPTVEVVAEAFVEMGPVVLNQWTPIRFPIPVYLPADREFAIVAKTDDAVHGLAYAKVGAFDPVAQQFVGAQPYSVGVMLSSSNARTWTPHQDEDLTFQIVAAKFSPTTKVVPLGSHAVTMASDFLARAAVELPTGDASFYFEIERASGQITRLQPDQPWELTEYITETVQFRAVLKGSEKISPILYPGVLLVVGKIRTSGTYVTRAFAMGTAIRLSTFLWSQLPAGAAVTIERDAADDNWIEVDETQATALNNGWMEREFTANPVTAVQGRLRVTITGGPGARPAIAEFRSVSI